MKCDRYPDFLTVVFKIYALIRKLARIHKECGCPVPGLFSWATDKGSMAKIIEPKK